MNLEVGLRPVSISLLSRIRSSKFAEYRIKRRGDSFSRCSKCDRIQTLKLSAVPGSADHKEFESLYTKHTNAQMSARAAYWSDRTHSKKRPLEFLCILHDKMDHSKTALPCLKSRTKDLDALTKLPISVTGMFAHGHGDLKYAHYSVDMFPCDSNFTIGSVAKLLRDLEEMPVATSRGMFHHSESNALFKAILNGKEMCFASLREPPQIPKQARPLPPVLHIQLDNCWRENKNRFCFCFWSLMVAKRIVREVVVSFMMVGHTHEDIDASFGRWSTVLKEKNHPTLPMLMKSYMDLDKDGPMIPHLIEEVPDFKHFIAPYMAEAGKTRLEGHSKGSQFRFFINDDGWPLMQYKLACTEEIWKPTHIAGIKLWKADDTGKPVLPPEDAEPFAVKSKGLKHEEEILKGIDGFIAHYNQLLEANVTPAFRGEHSHYVEYWTGVQDAIISMRDVARNEGDIPLKSGFWPQTRLPPDDMGPLNGVGRGYEPEYVLGEDDVEEEVPHYIGTLEDIPPPSFTTVRDIQKGFLVFVRPADDSEDPIWLGKVMNHPQMDPTKPNFKSFNVRWWLPDNSGETSEELYRGWDSIDEFCYKLDRSAKTQDAIFTDSVLASWKPSKGRKQFAPREQILFALDNLHRIQEHERNHRESDVGQTTHASE